MARRLAPADVALLAELAELRFPPGHLAAGHLAPLADAVDTAPVRRPAGTILRIGHAHERATRWHRQRPPINVGEKA